jgi:hypothetical protein
MPGTALAGALVRRIALGALVLFCAGLAGCGDDDAAPAPTATPTVALNGNERTPTATIDPGDVEEPTPTPTIGFCPSDVQAQCAQQCGGLGGCCAIPAPGSGAFSCFNPSVQCDFPCPDPMPGWIGNTQCGPAPGDDPSKACIVAATPTPTNTGTPTVTPTSACMDVGPVPPTAAATIDPGGPTPAPTSVDCLDGNTVVFRNNNPYPVWLAEAYQGSGDLSDNILVPPGGDWQLGSGAGIALCLPPEWSGRFWPRTECDFEGMFGNDPDFEACASTSDCSQERQPHICYGGRCLLDCTVGDTSFCQGMSGLGNADAICVHSAFAGDVRFCSYPQNTVCRTGDCQGLYQCYGEWDDNVATYTAVGPVSLFEPTSNSASNVNYDVSLVSGYNTQISARPSVESCYTPACVTDLNAVCPANLRVTTAPTASQGPIPCGVNTFCQSGACVEEICVIGCNDPADQCDTASPPTGLECGEVVPAEDGGDGTTTYSQMYLAKGPSGETMISGNQGTPTCWGALDCLPGEVCRTCIQGFPADVGICLPADGSLPQPQTDCAAQADVGKACGGYAGGFTDAITYACASIGWRAGDVACVPAYGPPVSGVGTLVTGTDGTTKFYSATASPLNPTWMAAARKAGGGTPWFEIFSNACPHQYGWQYDDHTGGFACNPADGSSVDFTITFGPP